MFGDDMRLYSFQDELTVSGDHDIFIMEMSPGVTEIHEVRLASSAVYADADSMGLELSFRRYTGTISGSTTFTKEPYSSDNLAAFPFFAKQTAAIHTGGTEQILLQTAWNATTGFRWIPPPELRPRFCTKHFIIRIDSAPAATLDVMVSVVAAWIAKP
jgi:hypothetical protein